jgi:ribosomal protein S18 acetylase RimI-like enzyme
MTDFVVQKLDPGRLGDWLRFFDGDAFADNHDWAGCYCHYYHADHAGKAWEARTADENRAATCERIAAGRMRGYLAYAGERPVGWLHAAPRTDIANIANDAELAVDDAACVGSIVCFVVAPAFRKQGVATRLLDAACADFRAQGLRFAEAYPRRAAKSDAAHYHGPPAMYLAAGFHTFRELPEVLIVRRDLADAARR